MNDLISRKALIAEYDRVHIGPPGGARKLMEDAPAVDAVPVVHGRLEQYVPTTAWRCNMCGRMHYLENKTPEEAHMNCCSQCGAVFNMEAYLSMHEIIEHKQRRATNE